MLRAEGRSRLVAPLPGVLIGALVVAVLAAAAGTGTAAAGGSLMVNGNVMLVAAIAVVVAIPIVVRLVSGRFDIFEPIVPISGALLLFFVARPIYDIRVSDYHFLGRDVSGSYGMALLSALVAAVAVQAGYHTPLPAGLARRLPRPPQALYNDVVVATALALTVIAGFFLLWSAHERGGVMSVFANRSADLASPVPFIAQGFMLALPAILLLLSVKTSRRLLLVGLASLPVGIILLMTVPGGNRRFLLPLVLSLSVLYFARKNKRPSLLLAMGACGLLLLTVVTPARVSRNGEVSYQSALLTSLNQPWESLTSVLQAQDTSMIDNVALEMDALGDGVPFRHGLEFLTDTVLLPIPGELWAGKPDKIRTMLIDYYYGTENGACVTQCPTFGLVGDLYADFGLVSVAMGSALLGLLFATGYQYFRQHSKSPVVQAAYSAGLWVAFYAWWGGFAFVTLLVALFVGPIAFTAVLAARRSPEAAMGVLDGDCGGAEGWNK